MTYDQAMNKFLIPAVVTVVLLGLLIGGIALENKYRGGFAMILVSGPKVLGILLLIVGLIKLLMSPRRLSSFDGNKDSIFLLMIAFACIHWGGAIALAIYLVGDKFATRAE